MKLLGETYPRPSKAASSHFLVAHSELSLVAGLLASGRHRMSTTPRLTSYRYALLIAPFCGSFLLGV